MPSFRAILLNKLLQSTAKGSWRLDSEVHTLRQRSSAMARFSRRPARYTTLVSPGCTIDRVEEGDSESSLVLLYLHGGGFFWHDAAFYRGFVARLCRGTGATAYLPDYRLAPEHPFPAGVNDCLEAYRWLLQQPGVDPQRLVIAGDSAGGSLVLTTLMQARDQGLPLPACAAVLSPFADATGGGSSFKDNAERDVIFTPEALDAMLNWYLPDSAEASNPLVSPVLGNLAGLPPILLQVGEPEMIRDDAVRCAEKLLEAGGVAELQVWDDMPHVFQAFPWLPEGNQALQKIIDFVRRYTHDSLERPQGNQ